MAITGIGTNGMNPNTQAAPQQRQGLLGGFFGPDGRDARARLAIGLEGLTLNPNQGLIGQLQSGIERRETAAQKNATAEWLRSRRMDDLVALFEAGASAQDVLGEATRRMQPADPMAAINLEKAQLELQNLRTPQPGFRLATTEEAAAYGAQAGQFGPDGRFYAEDVAQPTAPERGVVVGGNVVDPITGKIIYQGEIKTPDPQSAIAKLEADRRANLINDEQYKAGLQALAPTGMTIESDGAGGFRMVQGAGVGAGGKPATEGQLAGAGYLQRMTAAESILRRIETQDNVVAIPIEKTLLLGTKLEGYALNPTEQQVAQAQRDWVRAKLRKESGAVIGPEEMAAEIQTYFPLPGESQGTIAQKAEARRRAERQMQIGSGSAAEQAGTISPPYSAPIRMDELVSKGAAPAGSTSQPVVIDGVTIRKVN
jgi:hypothetical protein